MSATPPAGSAPPPRRRGWRWALAAALLLLVGVVVWIVATRHRCPGSPTAMVRLLTQAPDPALRCRAAVCLNHQREPPEGLLAAGVAALDDPDPRVRYEALGLLMWRARGLSSGDLRRAVELLSDPDPKTSERAARTLGHADAAALPYLPRLRELLDGDGSVTGRRAAAFLMGMLYADAPARVGASLPALVRAVESDDEQLRHWAVWSLREFGPHAAPAAEALGAFISRCQHEAYRSTAAQALEKVGAPAAPVLGELLGHADPRVREQAAQSLSLLRGAGASAAPNLARALGDPDPRVSSAARLALASSRPVWEASLIAWVRGGSPHGDEVLKLLAQTKPRSLEVEALVLECRAHPKLEVRRVAEVWQAYTRSAPEAVALLVPLLERADAQLRRDALVLLGSFGTGAGAATPDVERRLHDAVPRVRLAAAWALSRIDPARSDRAAWILARNADDDDGKLRYEFRMGIAEVAQARRKAGAPLWWVPLVVHARTLALALGLTALWFGLGVRFPRRRSRRRWRLALHLLLLGGVPAAGWGVAAWQGTQPWWVRSCLPELQQLLIPQRPALVLSLVGLLLLVGALVILRKPRVEEEEPAPAPPAPVTPT